jgi:hypothetical protein
MLNEFKSIHDVVTTNHYVYFGSASARTSGRALDSGRITRRPSTERGNHRRQIPIHPTLCRPHPRAYHPSLRLRPSRRAEPPTAASGAHRRRDLSLQAGVELARVARAEPLAAVSGRKMCNIRKQHLQHTKSTFAAMRIFHTFVHVSWNTQKILMKHLIDKCNIRNEHLQHEVMLHGTFKKSS